MQRRVSVSALNRKRDAYLELVKRFPLRPIRSDGDLDEAIAVIDGLLDQEAMDAGEQDYLDVLSDLVEKYEEQQKPIAACTDQEMLGHLLEARAISQAELARKTGIAESTISALRAGRRQLTRSQIGVLAAFFHVNPQVFAL